MPTIQRATERMADAPHEHQTIEHDTNRRIRGNRKARARVCRMVWRGAPPGQDGPPRRWKKRPSRAQVRVAREAEQMNTQHVERQPVQQLWAKHGKPVAPRMVAQTDILVGLDCDGVLASDRLLWQVLHKHYPTHIPEQYEHLQAYDWPRVTAETTELCLRLSADPGFAGRLAPIPHMAEALRRLHALGYRFQIVTARPDCVRGATRRWLARQGLDQCVEAIHCVAHPSEKVALVREIGCTAFVEDNHTTAEALGRAGIRSYLLDAPYNRLPTKASVRVRDWRSLGVDLRRQLPLGSASRGAAASTLEPRAALAI